MYNLKLISMRKTCPRTIAAALAAVFLAASGTKLSADWWTERTAADFSDGYFFRSTSTAAVPELNIKRVDDWYQVAQSTWLNRKPIKITNSGGALYAYQIQLTVNTSDYIAAGKMRADGADIRITDEDGKTLLPYWIGVSTSQLATSAAAPIWVKVSTVSASSIKYVYMYFNNVSTGTSLSSRLAVDDLYEDWESGTINPAKWTLGGAKGSQSFDADLFKINLSSKYEGGYCVKSGTITHTQSTYLEKIVNLEMPARITFYWASSCENIYDPFVFNINGAEPSNGRISGETSWVSRTFDLPSGAVTLRWQYQRDSGGSGGLNATWLDALFIRKYTSSPPSMTYEADEDFAGEFYRSAYYMSNVFDMGGENSFVDVSSWSAFVPGGGGVNLEYRRSNDAFTLMSSTPSTWVALTNGGAISQQSRYIQYRSNLSGPGTTSPALVEMSVSYRKVPRRPTGFRGIVISSTIINWEWNDLSDDETGFRIFSGTRTIPASPEGFISDTDGLLYAIGADTTFYIENNLSPNILYNRYVVAYNANGGNVSRRLSDSKILAHGVTTYAHAPAAAAEEFEFTGVSGYQYNAIPTQSVIYKSTFAFTSDVSTGPIEYYRVAFTTAPTHAFGGADTVWTPLTSTVTHPVGGNTITKKAETLCRATYNSDFWYFHAQTYNVGNIPSGVTTIGPFYYRGSPSRITDLVALPSPTDEGRVVLTWTAPTDNDGTAELVGGKFVIKRRADFLVVDDAQFSAATTVAVISTSTVGGQKQTYVVTGLAPGGIWGFAIKSVDSGDNYSALSTNVDFSTNTRCAAAKVAKLAFITPPRTTEVGAPTSIITVEARDSYDRPLKLYSAQDVYLYSTSLAGEFSLTPNEGDFGISFVTIIQGQSQASFYYRDFQSGNPSITVNEQPDNSWTEAAQSQTVLPAKAVKFVISHDGSGSIGTPESMSIYANDGYNAANVSTDYEGGMFTTSTFAGMQVVPSTHLYTTSDAGTKNFSLMNNFYAGPGVVTVYETIEQNFRDVFMYDSRAWAAADEGIVKKSVDGGLNWFAQKYAVGSANGFYGIHTPDASNVWAVGESGKIFVSTNSGTSWYAQTSGVAERLNSVYFADVSTGYAAGSSGRVVKSTCAGAAWIDLGQMAGSPAIYSVYFINASTGFVAGAGGKLFKTADGGANWSSVATGEASDLRKIFFFDETTAFAATSGGRVLRSADGGDTWTQAPATDQPLYAVAFVNALNGLAVGDKKTIVRTTDGGTNWVIVSSASAGRLNGVTYFSPSVAVAVGDGGLVMRTSNGGAAWSEVKMTGVSPEMKWNGMVSSFVPVAQRLVQRKNNQAVARLGLWNYYGGNSTINKVTLTRTGSASDAAVTAVKVYRDRNGNRAFDTADEPYLGEAVFSAGVAQISFSNQTISGTTSYLFVTYSLAADAPIGDTLGAQFNFGCVSVSGGTAFSRNNLPYDAAPLTIVPSSNTVFMTIHSTTPVTAQQGASNVRISSFSMITDVGESPFTRLRVERSSTSLNVTDSDISRVNLYRANNWDEIGPTNLVSTGAFSGGVALLSISAANNPSYPELFADINNQTTVQYFLTVDISPDSRYSTDTQDAKFGIKTVLATTYFTLDGEGANGIQPAALVFNSGLIKLIVAYDVVTINPVIEAIPVLRQSDTKAFLPLWISLDDNSAVWTKIRINKTGTAADSDIARVIIFRDTGGNGTLETDTDQIVGSARFSGGIADIVFATPETLDKKLPDYATYFIACEISKRATVGATLSISVASTASFTLGGVDIVSPSNFPIQSAVATIQDYPDVVSASIKSIAPRDATVAESNVALLSVGLTAFCDATLQRVVVALEGTAERTNVSAVKIYYDSDGDALFSAAADTLLGSAVFDVTNRASVNLTAPLTVYDVKKTIFIVYDFNPAGAPDKTIGAGIDYTGLQYNLPNAGYNFGYARSSMLNLLDRRTPTLPTAAMIIDNPSGVELSPGKKTYFLNKNYGISFTWASTAENGIKELGYSAATYDYTVSTDVPDVAAWRSATASSVDFDRLNLKHNTTYYLWFKAVSTDDYERVNTYEIKIDLTAPPPPVKPETTASAGSSTSTASSAPSRAAAAGYWVSWNPVKDDESGILYYELSERVGADMWVSVATTTATDYFVATSSPAKFYYYRVRAKNYAGTWSGYSLPSSVAYLTLPDEPLANLSTYPNPFDSRKNKCGIVYILNTDTKVDMRIYDLLGGLVRRWEKESGETGGAIGLNEISWDGTDENGAKVAMGMYILSVEMTASDGSKKNKRWKIGVIH